MSRIPPLPWLALTKKHRSTDTNRPTKTNQPINQSINRVDKAMRQSTLDNPPSHHENSPDECATTLG
ncbi:hypothetical protein [Yersinia similis]|uniref:hypothetical protein n=1 Tax=Yersinia similis TaxID=367190 RepID=UPI0012E2ACFD|nr:hypothetical protein [Yersinia similis]